MARGDCGATVHGVSKSRSRLSDWTELNWATNTFTLGINYLFSRSVQSLSHVWLCDTMDCSTPSFHVHHQLAQLAQTHIQWYSDAIKLSHSLLPPSPPAFCLSQHQGLSNGSVLCIRWPKYWSFSFSISPSNEYLGLISFKIDWFDLLAVQETLKSLLQYHSSKASILQYSAFFIVKLSHSYVTTGKTIALTRWTFVGKVMSLLFNMLSGLVIALLPKSKHLLISWLRSPSAVILEPQKIKSVNCIHCFPTYWPWSDGTRCQDLSLLNVEF